jgi:hypothetical protein
MDNGSRQKEKAEWLKLEVKRLAAARRQRQHIQGLELGMDKLDVANASDSSASAVLVSHHGSKTTASSPPTHVTSDAAQDSGTDSWMREPSLSARTSSTPQSSVGPALDPSSSAFTGLEAPVNGVGLGEMDLGYVVFYLDFVFPFLYPFYRPAMLDGGRAWLLVTLMRNKSLFHIALSLTGYIFSEVLKSGDRSHTQCLKHNWNELQHQQELAMQELQADIQELNNRGICGYVKENTRALGSMVQILSSEVAIANAGNWQIHLQAASFLFDQIMEHRGTAEDGSPCWYRVLRDLGEGPVVPHSVPDIHRPWSADQASLRFFTASLLFFDTLSATALEQPPRLQKYHDHLLTTFPVCCNTHPSLACKPHLNMEEFFGVPNWVFLAIARTATLAAWKKEEKLANSLSMTCLVARAVDIEQDLRTHIQDLDLWLNGLPPTQIVVDDPSNPLSTPTFTPYDRALISRIWAQAALTYLSVVVSGWQPSSPEVRTSVTATISLIQRLSSPVNLRTVVWPFAVTGCLATACEEQFFRDLVAGMGPLQAFGTVREALQIMEQAWTHRDCLEVVMDNWDLAACFRSLGHPALLV